MCAWLQRGTVCIVVGIVVLRVCMYVCMYVYGFWIYGFMDGHACYRKTVIIALISYGIVFYSDSPADRTEPCLIVQGGLREHNGSSLSRQPPAKRESNGRR